MNWKKGISRFFWVLSFSVGIIVLFFGWLDAPGLNDARSNSDAVISFFAAAIAFGLVWLFYVLSRFIYRGFIDENSNIKQKEKKVPRSHSGNG